MNGTENPVLTKKEAAGIIGVSTDTLDRMTMRGDGPPRVRLSERRVGFRLRDLILWLDARKEVSKK